MTTVPSDSIRCAIYTRTSSDERLDQLFNSLDAQRECCEAYIVSQRECGWTIDETRYDDGGVSGGSLERPALQKLLTAVDRGAIQTIVVYKVDRITRSLADFARLLERFEQRSVGFVSVTQALNTSQAMGRLTLNILLSFAQFERDQTGERIRDKIKASKSKGMWMGGNVPLGYDVPDSSGDRRLIVNSTEAEAVRQIFDLFLRLRTLSSLQERLSASGIHSKRWLTSAGRWIGGYEFSRGALRHLLRNPIYLGQISHQGVLYKGRHDAIVGPSKFSASQRLLAAGSLRWRRRRHPAHSPLAGRVFDPIGRKMWLVRAKRGERQYSYYATQTSSGSKVDGSQDGWRVPQTAVDRLVFIRLARLSGSHDSTVNSKQIKASVERVELKVDFTEILLSHEGFDHLELDEFLSRLPPGDRAVPEVGGAIRIIVPGRLKLRGGRVWPTTKITMISKRHTEAVSRLRKAHAIGANCLKALTKNRSAVMKATMPEGPVRSIEWAFLAPDIQRSILNSTISESALENLSRSSILPLSWAKQRDLLRTD